MDFSIFVFFGLGKHSVSKIVTRYGLKPGYLISSLPPFIISDLEQFVFTNFRFGRSYQRSYLQSKNFKVRSGLYAGIRMSRGLPVRGQRTKTNASTAKRLNKSIF